MTNKEAARLRLCLLCGEPGARLLRLRDGRNVRACDRCLGSAMGADWLNSKPRDPLPAEESQKPGDKRKAPRQRGRDHS